VDDLPHRYHQAWERFDNGEHGAAATEIRMLAEQGYPLAQVFAGWLSESGRMGPIDLVDAKRWYTAAAEAGSAVGEYYLGGCLLRHGDPSGGAKWVKQAAAQGYVPALYWLGRLHETGRGIAKDAAAALGCITKAAEAGHPFAQRWIASRRIRGCEGFVGVLRGLVWFISTPALVVKLESDEHIDRNLLHG
jgi:TPR repeat protein